MEAQVQVNKLKPVLTRGLIRVSDRLAQIEAERPKAFVQKFLWWRWKVAPDALDELEYNVSSGVLDLKGKLQRLGEMHKAVGCLSPNDTVSLSTKDLAMLYPYWPEHS